MCIQRLELEAARARRELGDEEIARRVKAIQDDWKAQCATWREYHRGTNARMPASAAARL